MKQSIRHFAIAALALTAITAQAQYNPYSRDYHSQESPSFGTFFVEYNPHTVHTTTAYSATNTTHDGLSVGFNYFVPVVSHFGIDAGLKGQYFFHKETVFGVKEKYNQFSATVPVDLVIDIRLADGFAIDPFAGLYGRYDLIAKETSEVGGKRSSVNLFEKSQTNQTMNRFQLGWQAGVNLRIAQSFTVGASYWMDFSELRDRVKLYGFDLRLGLNF